MPLEVKLVDVYRGQGRSPEYLAIRPAGKVPVLVDGDFVLGESNAILQYLSEVHGGFGLWSRDPALRANIARWYERIEGIEAWKPTATAPWA